MAGVTFTDVVTGAGIRPLRVLASQGDIKIAFTKVTFDDSYPLSGESCDLATQCGLQTVLLVIPTAVTSGTYANAGTPMYSCYWDPSSQKLVAFAGCAEVPAGTNMSAWSVTLMVIGM